MNEDEGNAKIALLAALPRMVQIRKPHGPSMRQAGGRRDLQVFTSLKLTWMKLTWMFSLGEELVVRTSKTGQPVVHPIDSCELVVDCLRRIGETEGPIARQANGLPWPDRQSFSKAWREIAEAAGIPRNVWNMDSRALGISEASEAGVSDDDITKQAGNSVAVMKRVYKRKGKQASERSHSKRQEHRRKEAENETKAK